MPKSKRQRSKLPTKATKKRNELKQNLVGVIRNAVDTFESAYVFSFRNMRSNHFKNVRMDFKDSRFFLGKNKVMKLALGHSKEEEYVQNIYRLSKDINGNTGLLFTNRSHHEVLNYFSELSISDYPRSGFVATETVAIPEGPLPQFIGSMIESLRGLGLPLDLKKGVVVLNQNYTICKIGQTLTPEQAKLLVHFDRKMAKFKLVLLSVWSKDKYQRIASDDTYTTGDDDENM
ncbi:mrna turnover protein 4 homolog [Plasmopara halstedii]|uniref:Ribosome assembly factor mrt4 n=1 Tax=Plasmopara halstedii TaxID=4781 RepID=A0A0N7L4G5_PLAHL|nr:mrna turnover protein 4 homolog [Plasmopara halstedii]CEG38611.1 mrna turnover protein 4 homolog [Plasmopara halstedii]|eukprot:XP_024574980.1 mrna turnover protein 4 homolog [Plasmopara halstedii]